LLRFLLASTLSSCVSGVSRINVWARLKSASELTNVPLVSSLSHPYTHTHTHTHTSSPLNLICPPLQGTAKVLVDGTADGIAEHFKQLFERGERIVFELRDILRSLGLDPDEFLPIRLGEGPFIAHMRATMKDTCNTARAASNRIIEEKNLAGIAHFGEEVWEGLPPLLRETFDGDCCNHLRQLPVAEYLRKVGTALQELLKDYADEARKMMGPQTRIELDGQSLLRSCAKMLDIG